MGALYSSEDLLKEFRQHNSQNTNASLNTLKGHIFRVHSWIYLKLFYISFLGLCIMIRTSFLYTGKYSTKQYLFAKPQKRPSYTYGFLKSFLLKAQADYKCVSAYWRWNIVASGYMNILCSSLSFGSKSINDFQLSTNYRLTHFNCSLWTFLKPGLQTVIWSLKTGGGV